MRILYSDSLSFVILYNPVLLSSANRILIVIHVPDVYIISRWLNAGQLKVVVDITRHVVYRIHKIISVIGYHITLEWPRYISQKVRNKCLTGLRFICTKVTYYKIHTLAFQQPTLHWFINYKMLLQKYFDPIVDARHTSSKREATLKHWSSISSLCNSVCS